MSIHPGIMPSSAIGHVVQAIRATAAFALDVEADAAGLDDATRINP